jgi:hypothetical protein
VQLTCHFFGALFDPFSKHNLFLALCSQNFRSVCLWWYYPICLSV